MAAQRLVLMLAGAGPAALVAQQPPAAGTALVFDSVAVVDVEQGQLIPSQRVVIVGNRIQAMGNVDAVPLPSGMRRISAAGKYLMPGLWDMHIHTMMDAHYGLFIAAGVTGFRDAAAAVPLDTMALWRREILAGTRG